MSSCVAVFNVRLMMLSGAVVLCGVQVSMINNRSSPLTFFSRNQQASHNQPNKQNKMSAPTEDTKMGDAEGASTTPIKLISRSGDQFEL